MKKSITVILFCFFLLPIAVSAKSLDYINQNNHYSFSLPDGWVEIPKPTINTAMRNVAEQTGANPNEYSAGFQMQATADFQYPYLLVQEFEMNTQSHAQIIKEIAGGQLIDDLDKFAKKYSDFIIEATIGTPYLDKEKNVILMTSYLTDPNNEQIRVTTAIFLGKNNTTRLFFYTTEDTYKNGTLAINKIMDTFKYEVAYAYNESEAKKNDPRSIFENVAEKGIIGGFTALIIGLFLGIQRLFVRSKNKE